MLKLRYSPSSPYVRKVMMVAIEAGIADRIEKVVTNAWDPQTTLPADNPLGKVPTLVLEDGMTLFDSPVICEYLARLNPEVVLLPPAGPERWRILRLQALADGIMDAAVARRLESMRPESLRSADWSARQKAAVDRGCDFLEANPAELQGEPNLGSLAVAAAFGYLDFRFAEEDWRIGRPMIKAWFKTASERDSFVTTAPPPA